MYLSSIEGVNARQIESGIVTNTILSKYLTFRANDTYFTCVIFMAEFDTCV